MAPPDLGIVDLSLVCFYAALLMLPGGLVAVAGGLRGWQLVAGAPLLTYAVAGLTGPWSSSVGIGWSPLVLAVGAVGLAAAVAGARIAVTSKGHGRPTACVEERPRPGRPERWSRGSHVALAAAVVVAAMFGAAAILGGLRRLSTIPQDWDAVFHANGIRWIADTGDAGLFGMSQVNWYEPGTEIFYPNAYHLLGAVVRQVTLQDLPSILNAHTALIPGLAAVMLAALVRRLGGSVVHAAGTALAAVAVSAVYDMLWRGPLLPYATGAVLTPAFVILIVEYLDADGARDRWGKGVLLGLATAGLLCLHPSMLFGAAVFATGYLLWRWARRPVALRREPLLLAAAGAFGLALSFLQIRGSLYSAASFPPVDWPADLSAPDATVALLTFSHAATTYQVWPTVFAGVGLLTYHRLGGLRWIGGPAAVFGILFVLAASSDASWVNAITRPWWNDRWRLAAIFALIMCVLIGHGLAQTHRFAMWLLQWLLERTPVSGGSALRVGPTVAAALVLLGFVGASNMLYLDRNATKMSINTGQGPAISSGEIAAIEALGRMVPPGTRVLNDRNDGSVWMYALAGVRPVAGHYDATGLGGTDVELLETRFNRYAEDVAVRDAVQRLNVEYVMVGQGFLRGYNGRAAGLTDLGLARYLSTVYQSPDATIYRINAGNAVGSEGGAAPVGR